MLYIPTDRGGPGMIRLTNFCHAIKVSWVRSYAIDKIYDHWAEMVDTHFFLTSDMKSLNMAPKNSTN